MPASESRHFYFTSSFYLRANKFLHTHAYYCGFPRSSCAPMFKFLQLLRSVSTKKVGFCQSAPKLFRDLAFHKLSKPIFPRIVNIRISRVQVTYLRNREWLIPNHSSQLASYHMYSFFFLQDYEQLNNLEYILSHLPGTSWVSKQTTAQDRDLTVSELKLNCRPLVTMNSEDI